LTLATAFAYTDRTMKPITSRVLSLGLIRSLLALPGLPGASAT
jgi:hypothetical protein